MTRDDLLSAGQLDTQQAQQSFQRAAALLALAQEAIVVWDAATDAVAFWNRGAEAVYGWPRAEIVGQPARTLLQTRFPQLLERIEAALRRDGHWEGELDQTRRDGRAITVASRWALQRDGKGQSVAILEVSTDITARKALERALRGRDAIAETAQRVTRLGNFHWDVATDTVHWSDEMFRLLGQDPGQVTPSIRDRNISEEDIEDAVTHPLNSVYDFGRASYTYIGSKVTVIINTAGKVITLYPTARRIVRRLTL